MIWIEDMPTLEPHELAVIERISERFGIGQPDAYALWLKGKWVKSFQSRNYPRPTERFPDYGYNGETI
jgi:hypothetical protein